MTTDTYEMGVENISFMLEKWNSDLHPLGSYRELAMNSIEAILRTPEGTGTVEFGIYEPHYQLTGTPKLCCIDTGDGMSAAKLEKYINNLGASINQQEFDKNYGGGLKIGVVPANPEGVTFLSWEKDKPGNQVTVWKDPETGVFGLKKIKLMDGSYGYSAPVDAAFKPGLIKASGSGTVVILHGTSETENTMGVPAKIQRSKRSVKNWLPRYLNERFYVIPDGVELTVRQNPKIDTESRDSFGIQITGQKAFLTANSEEHGIEDLPLAKYHWYVLKDSKTLSRQYSGIHNTTGHVGSLFKGEVHDQFNGSPGYAKLQDCGILFSAKRVVLFVEPKGKVAPNYPRTRLHLDDSESLDWPKYTEEFRANMPDAISTLEKRIATANSNRQTRPEFRKRLQQIGPFLEVSRYVPDEEADTKVTPSDIGTGGQSGSGNQAKKTTKNENASRVTKSGSGGNIYELFQGEDGANPAKKVTSNQPPEVVWKTITDGSRGIGELDDRAARYLAGPGVILANQDFRVIQDTIQQCLKPYKQIPAARQVVEQTVRDWYGFYLQQTVIMGESLRGSERWVGPCIKQLLSEEALTASILTKWSIMEQVKKDVAIRIRESRKAS